MNFDKNLNKKIDKKSELLILLRGGLVFDIAGFLLFLLGLLSKINNQNEESTTFFTIAIVLFCFGIKNIFLNSEQKTKYLTSKTLEKLIKEEKRNGKQLTEEEIDKLKFKYDPIFHDKIVSQVHKEQDYEYEKRIIEAKKELNDLRNSRIAEIKRINDERWKSIGNENLQYNLIEGKISINQTIHLFSSIKGAEVTKEDSYRVITTETGKTRKHGSLGGAVAGGLLFGPVGAIVGGSTLGKTTTKGNSLSNSIPTCNHIGVVIDIDGFKTEIILLNHTVDQSSTTYINTLQTAEEIVSKLHFLSTQPVPENYKETEEEQTVLNINKEIAKAEIKLESIKEQVPKYEIPERYLYKKEE